MQLKTIEKNDQRVLTSSQIAEVYGTDTKTLSKNFNRNKSRYTEGKHYFIISGNDLKEFKTHHQIDDQLKHSPILYLWTAKGALFHAKSLGTDEAWNAYEQLVDDYFNKVEQIQRMNVPTVVPTTIEGILELAVMNMKDLRNEISQVREENNKLRLVVDNEVILTENQKALIQEAVKKRVGQLMKKGYESHFQSIYSALKVHFTVPKYDKIKRSDFENAISFIEGWYPKKSEQTSSNL